MLSVRVGPLPNSSVGAELAWMLPGLLLYLLLLLLLLRYHEKSNSVVHTRLFVCWAIRLKALMLVNGSRPCCILTYDIYIYYIYNMYNIHMYLHTPEFSHTRTSFYLFVCFFLVGNNLQFGSQVFVTKTIFRIMKLHGGQRFLGRPKKSPIFWLVIPSRLASNSLVVSIFHLRGCPGVVGAVGDDGMVSEVKYLRLDSLLFFWEGLYPPRAPMTSIFEGQPPQNKALFNQNKGHLGSRQTRFEETTERL